MGEHRMIAKQVMQGWEFLELPFSAQALYYQLELSADDDGLLSNAKVIQRMANASDEDLNILIAKGFIISFDSGVIAITHWHILNKIRKDRRKDTAFKKEFSQLAKDENGCYYIIKNGCQPNDNQTTTQDNIMQGNTIQDNKSQENISKENRSEFNESEGLETTEQFASTYGNLNVIKLTDSEYLELTMEYGVKGFNERVQKVEKAIQANPDEYINTNKKWKSVLKNCGLW